MQKHVIYRIELKKATEEGHSGTEAERIAMERADDVYWRMVDSGREQAKDRE